MGLSIGPAIRNHLINQGEKKVKIKDIVIVLLCSVILIGCSADYSSEINNGAYSYACSKREAFLYEYRWDGTEDGQAIIVPDSIEEKEVTAIGGFYGRGLPMLFKVNLEEAYDEPGGEWLQYASSDDITDTEYITFDLHTSLGSDKIQLSNNIYYHKVDDKITKYIVEINIKNGNDIYSDVQTVQALFPNVQIKKAYYEMIPLGGASDRVPGPTDYRYVGVVVVEDEYKKNVLSEYELTAENVEIDENLSGLLKLKETAWETSKELNEDLKPSYFDGNIYVNENTIYFELTTN